MRFDTNGVPLPRPLRAWPLVSATDVPPFSVTFLAVSNDPDPNYPCGTVIPGWGMGGAGELLISMLPPEPTVLLIGPIWTGAGNPGKYGGFCPRRDST